MSLDTLLEAAEFIELRSQDDRYKNLHGYAKRPPADMDRESASTSEMDRGGDVGDGKIKDLRMRNRCGKISPIYVGPPDGFYMRAGTREVHNKLEKGRRNLKGKEYAPYVSSAHNWLEKNRRAHLKECFEFLKKNIPSLEDHRTSNLGILRGSLRYIQILKRKNHDFESEMRHLSQEKMVLQGRMQRLHVELQRMNVNIDINALANVHHENDNDTNSTSTATERGTPPPSDHSEDDDDEEEAEKLVMETNPSPIPTRLLLPKPSPQKGSAIKDLLFNGVTANPSLSVNSDCLSDKIIEAAQGLIYAKNLMISNPGYGTPLASTAAAVPTAPKSVPIRPVLSQTTMLNLAGIPWKGVPVTMTPVTMATVSMAPVTMTPITMAPVTMTPSTMAMVSMAPMLAPASMAPPTATPMVAPRTPVTQILHRTLTKKALMKQEWAASVSHATTNPATAARLVAPSLTNIPITIAMAPPSSPVIATSGVPINPAVADTKPTVLSTSPADWQNKIQMAGAVPLSFPYYMAASLPQFAHPILVTSLKAPTLNQTSLATGSTNTATMVPMATLTTAAIKTEPNVEVNFAGNTAVSIATTAAMTSPVQIGLPSIVKTEITSSVQTGFPPAVQAGFPLRPVFAPNLLSGQFALPLLSQTVPRTTAMVSATMVTTPATWTSQTNVSSASSHVSTVPMMSMAQMSPLGQLMSPVTVMSPGAQLAAGGFTSAQLNSIIAASPYLKQFSTNTIVPQSILPAGQVIGQMVKPMVVVTMPGMTSTTNMPSVALTSPMQTTANVTSS